MPFFDWFFATAVGHWLLNHVAFWQLFVLCILKLLGIVLFGEGFMKVFRAVNWRFVVNRMKSFRLPGKAFSWE